MKLFFKHFTKVKKNHFQFIYLNHLESLSTKSDVYKTSIWQPCHDLWLLENFMELLKENRQYQC